MNGLIALFALCAVPAIVAVAAIWGGFIASILWGWFAVPVFGLPPLSIPAAIGLGLVASCFVRSSVGRSDDDQPAARLIAKILLRPALMLCLGWVAKQFL